VINNSGGTKSVKMFVNETTMHDHTYQKRRFKSLVLMVVFFFCKTNIITFLWC
jgi:hypothetical protein